MEKKIAPLVAALMIAGAGLVQAQTKADARWSAWLGCWRTADADGPITCVVPNARPSAVDVLTVVNGQIESRERIDADGQAHPIDRAGCHGTETATWSSTGHRLYRRDDLICPGSVNGIATTLMAISSSGEWLNIEGVQAGAGSLERLDRYHDVELPSSLPKEIRTAIARRRLAIATARAAAAAPITESDVAEAAANVESGVVRSWLAESGAVAALADVVGPTPQPQAQNATMYDENRAASCAPTGCYAPNPYSPYNGYSMYPYSPYGPVYAPNAFGFVAPIVIVHGSNRPPVHRGGGFPRHEPSGHEPFGHTGSGHEPPSGRPLRPQGPTHEPLHVAPPMRAHP